MSGFFGALLGGAPSRRSVGMDDYFDALFGAGGRGAKSGVAVNADTALQCMTALACVQVLACGVAMLPAQVVREQENGGFKPAKDSPLWWPLVEDPNEWQTSTEWVETMMMHAVLCGDGVSFINRSRPGGPIKELIPLHPLQVGIRQNPDYTLTYQVTLADGKYLELGRRDVFHLRAPSWNSYTGLNATRLAREAIGLALATEETHARLHSNGARPSGALTSDARLDQAAIDKLRAMFAESQGGLANSSKPVVLSHGLKWQSMVMNGVDSQHIETRRFQIEEICRAFGVFPAIIGHSDKAATFASAEQFFLAHVIHSLGRWIDRFEKRVAKDLFSIADRQTGLKFQLDTRGLLRGDNKSRAEFYNALINIGVLTRNEARMWEGLNPLPGLDTPLQPLNMGTGGTGMPVVVAKQFATFLESKAGRVISAANESRIVDARDNLNEVLAQIDAQPEA